MLSYINSLELKSEESDAAETKIDQGAREEDGRVNWFTTTSVSEHTGAAGELIATELRTSWTVLD